MYKKTLHATHIRQSKFVFIEILKGILQQAAQVLYSLFVSWESGLQ